MRLLGAWRIAREQNAGEDNPHAADNGYWFHESHVVIGSADAAWEWPIRLDATTTPHAIDMWSDDPRQAFRDLGIWAETGGILQICWGVRDSGLRPADFASTPGNGWQLLELVPSDEPEPT